MAIWPRGKEGQRWWPGIREIQVEIIIGILCLSKAIIVKGGLFIWAYGGKVRRARHVKVTTGSINRQLVVVTLFLVYLTTNSIYLTLLMYYIKQKA